MSCVNLLEAILRYDSIEGQFLPLLQVFNFDSLECSQGVFGDAGVVSEVHSGADGGEDEGVPVAAARHPDGVRRVQHDVVLVPSHLQVELVQSKII